MTTSSPPERPKQSALLPVMGLFMAIACAVISVFSAPIIVKLLQDNIAIFKERTERLSQQDKTLFKLLDQDFTQLHLILAVVIWFICMALFVMVVSQIAGRASLVEQEARTVAPRKSELTAKEIKKYERKIEQQRLERIKVLKKMKSKAEAEARRKKD